LMADGGAATNSTDPWALDGKSSLPLNLVFLDHAFAKPVVLPLNFDLARSPFTDSDSRRAFNVGGGPLWWITLTPDLLVIGKANDPGLWTVPRSQIDGAIGNEVQHRTE